MSSLIIHQETIPLRVTAFKRFPVKAAIDRGSSLTKVAFVSKDSPDDAEVIQLHCVTFLNEHFIEGVKFLKENGKLPAEGSLHVTGVGAATYRDQIKEIVGLDVTFINEIATIAYGTYLFVNNCEPDDIFFPKPDYKIWSAQSENMEKFIKNMREKVVQTEGNFPAIVLYVGSGCGLMKVNEDGSANFAMGTALSGKPFMGLAHALVGTADYEELMELATQGDRSRTDLLVRDLLKDDPNSPYGKYDPDMPTFPFGRAANKSWDRTTCRREDLAVALVAFVASQMVGMVSSSIMNHSLSKFYVSGNFFRHEITRSIFFEKISMLTSRLDCEVNFLKTGHGGALAAMFLEPEDCAKLVR